MKKVLRLLGLFIVLGLAYLLLWPVPIDPGSWTPAPIPEMEGVYQVNDKLQGIEKRYAGLCHECEDVAIDSSGNIYGGSVEGAIVQFSPTGTRTELVNTGGRPLGLDFGKNGKLYIADAMKGLLELDINTKQLKVLSTTHGGRDFKFVDDLEVADDGKIYFSDASDKFGFHDFQADLMEHRPNGRLLVYDPVTDKTDMLVDKLFFANGVAISPMQDFVLVNETAKYRVQRHWLQGAKKGTTEIFIENLPAFPDGISQGDDGVFWLALVSPRQQALDDILSQPFVRKIVMRLPESMQVAPEKYSFILGLNRNGQVVKNLQDPAGSYVEITSVQQFDNQLFIGSLKEKAIGVYTLQ